MGGVGTAGCFLNLYTLCLGCGRYIGATGKQMGKSTLQKLLVVILAPASFLTRVVGVLQERM